MTVLAERRRTLMPGVRHVETAVPARSLAESVQTVTMRVRRQLESTESAGREIREMFVLYLVDNRRFLNGIESVPVAEDLELDTQSVRMVRRDARGDRVSYADWLFAGENLARTLEEQVESARTRL